MITDYCEINIYIIFGLKIILKLLFKNLGLIKLIMFGAEIIACSELEGSTWLIQ